MTTSSCEVLAAKGPSESLFFVLNPTDRRYDGRVERNGESTKVPFWSYVNRVRVTPILSSKFHKELWKGNMDDDIWANKFFLRSIPFSKQDMDAVKGLPEYVEIPSKSADPEVSEERATMPENRNQDEEQDAVKAARSDNQPCWPGYEMIGMKPGKNGKMVPNCVPIKAADDELGEKATPSAADLDVIADAVGMGGVPQERITGDVLRGYGPRRGNLEQLLRYWRPIMRKPGGFRRCLAILADHPELYPLENLCAWLHHETTGLWPNEGCHHPGMKNCRRKIRGVVNGSVLSNSEFESRMRRLGRDKKSGEATLLPLDVHTEWLLPVVNHHKIGYTVKDGHVEYDMTDISPDAVKALTSALRNAQAVQVEEKREYSQERREEYAKKGWALPDGSYPIRDVGDLRNAVMAYGRAKDKAKAKAHIIKRARALSAMGELPEDWQ